MRSWRLSDPKKASDRSMLWQRVFLGLLLVCVAQVSYWVVEQIGQAQERRDIQLEGLSAYSTIAERDLGSEGTLSNSIKRDLDFFHRLVAAGN